MAEEERQQMIRNPAELAEKFVDVIEEGTPSSIVGAAAMNLSAHAAVIDGVDVDGFLIVAACSYQSAKAEREKMLKKTDV